MSSPHAHPILSTTLHQKRQITLGKRLFLPYQASSQILLKNHPEEYAVFFNEREVKVLMERDRILRKRQERRTARRHARRDHLRKNSSDAVSGTNLSASVDGRRLSRDSTQESAMTMMLQAEEREQEMAQNADPNLSAHSLQQLELEKQRERDLEELLHTDPPSMDRVQGDFSSSNETSSMNTLKGSHASTGRKRRPSITSQTQAFSSSHSNTSPYITLTYKCYGTISSIELFHNYIVVVLIEGTMLFLQLSEDETEIKKIHQLRIPANVHCMKAVEKMNQIVLLSNNRRIYIYEAESLAPGAHSTESRAPPVDLHTFKCDKSWFVNRHMNSISRSRSMESPCGAGVVLLIGFVSGEYAILELNKHTNTLEMASRGGTATRQSDSNIQEQMTPTSSTKTPNELTDELRIYKALNTGDDVINMPLFIRGDVKWKDPNGGDGLLHLAVFASLDGHIIVDDPLNMGNYQHLGGSPHSATTPTSQDSHSAPVSHWHLNLETEIVGVTPIDINGDGFDELMIVTWDGVTYFVDQNQNMVTFNLKQRVCGYTIGRFTIVDECAQRAVEESRLESFLPTHTTDTPLCIFYLTFSERIVVCSNVTMESIPMTTFEFFYDEETQDLLMQFADTTELRDQKRTQLVTRILYGSVPDNILDMYIAQLAQERGELSGRVDRLKAMMEEERTWSSRDDELILKEKKESLPDYQQLEGFQEEHTTQMDNENEQSVETSPTEVATSDADQDADADEETATDTNEDEFTNPSDE